MPSMLETNQYHTARRFLLAGKRESTLVIAGDLLRSATGRELALSLLAEMYPEEPKGRNFIARPAWRSLSGDSVLVADEQEG